MVGNLNVNNKDWLTYSGRTNRFGELCYSFSISNNLIQMINFPPQIPGCDFHGPGILDFFLSSDTSIHSNMAFLPLEISDHIIVSISIDFPSYSQQNAPYH